MAEHVVLTSRVVLSFILIAAGIAKVVNWGGFARAVVAFGILPIKAAAALSRALPIAEIAVGLCLTSRRLAPWPAVAALSLFVLFSLAMLLVLLRGNTNVPCGCFGSGRKSTVGNWAVVRNLGFITLALMNLGIPAIKANVIPLGAMGGLIWLGALCAESRNRKRSSV